MSTQQGFSRPDHSDVPPSRRLSSRAAVLISLLAAGALMIGCGSRADHSSTTKLGCAPQPIETANAAAAPSQVAPAPTVVAKAPAPVESAKPEPVKKPVVKVKDLDAPLKVRRLVVAESVARDKREPVGEKSTFTVDEAEKIYAFVEVENPTRAESEVFVTFEPEDNGASQGQVTLRVGESHRWRTWAFTRGANKVGSWAAVVRSANGAVLARTPFDVTL